MKHLPIFPGKLSQIYIQKSKFIPESIHTIDTSVYEEIKFYVVGWGGMIVSFNADYLKSADLRLALWMNELLHHIIWATQLLSREKLKFAGWIENTFLDQQLNLYR